MSPSSENSRHTAHAHAQHIICLTFGSSEPSVCVKCECISQMPAGTLFAYSLYHLFRLKWFSIYFEFVLLKFRRVHFLFGAMFWVRRRETKFIETNEKRFSFFVLFSRQFRSIRHFAPDGSAQHTKGLKFVYALECIFIIIGVLGLSSLLLLCLSCLSVYVRRYKGRWNSFNVSFSVVARLFVSSCTIKSIVCNRKFI